MEYWILLIVIGVLCWICSWKKDIGTVSTNTAGTHNPTFGRKVFRQLRDKELKKEAKMYGRSVITDLAGSVFYGIEVAKTIEEWIDYMCRRLDIDVNDNEKVLKIVNKLKGEEVDWKRAFLIMKSEWFERLKRWIWGYKIRAATEELRKVNCRGVEYSYVEISVHPDDEEKVDKFLNVSGRVLCDDGYTTGFMVEGFGEIEKQQVKLTEYMEFVSPKRGRKL